MRGADAPDSETARGIIDKLFFSDKRYDLSRVGRYKLDRKLGTEVEKNVALFGNLLEGPNADDSVEITEEKAEEIANTVLKNVGYSK